MKTGQYHPPKAHGGTLQNLITLGEQRDALLSEVQQLPSWHLSIKQMCDVELLLNGGFSPLKGFLGREDYESVLNDMRLSDGTLWPIPVTLDVTQAFAQSIRPGSRVALRDPEGIVLAILNVSDVWQPDLGKEAIQVFDTDRSTHPGVYNLFGHTHEWYVGGSLEGIQLPKHYDFHQLRLSPRDVRTHLEQAGAPGIAFQTRNPMHRVHLALTLQAAEKHDGIVLIHPAVGTTCQGDIDHFTRVRCYQEILKYYPPGRALLALLPLAMRMAGPREALWHAIIRLNYGCSKIIVGRDHAGCSCMSTGESFYEPGAARELVEAHQEELGIEVIPFTNMVYLPKQDTYVPENEVPETEEFFTISGSQLRRSLLSNTPPPEWYTPPEVFQQLRRVFPGPVDQGFTVFFTGLSGAGKSTLAKILMNRLLEIGHRQVTLLDGDVVRQHLSTKLGFSKKDRDENVRRIGFVAAEITKHGGVAICAPIAPYEDTRQSVKRTIEEWGRCFIVHVATPLETCEARDVKGLYKKAREGTIKHFTGISDPYEEPVKPDIYVVAEGDEPGVLVDQIIEQIRNEGFLPS